MKSKKLKDRIKKQKEAQKKALEKKYQKYLERYNKAKKKKQGSLYEKLGKRAFKRELANLNEFLDRPARITDLMSITEKLTYEQMRIIAVQMWGKADYYGEGEEGIAKALKDPNIYKDIDKYINQIRRMSKAELNKLIHDYLTEFGNDFLEYEGAF